MKQPKRSEVQSVGLKVEFSRLVKTKIKAAALESFAKHGYHGVTIRQIAARAGTTHTTFYQYFKGKADLIVELGHDMEPELLGIARALDDALVAPSWKAVRNWLDAYDEMWGRNHAIFDAYWEALGDQGVSQDMMPYASKMSEQMPKLLSRFEGRELARVKLSISMMTFQVYQAMLVGNSIKHASKKKDILDTTADMLWNSLKVWLAGRPLPR